MSNEQSLPPSGIPGQPEFLKSSSPGNEWNNGISRRNFLKRTGGATVATFVTWHGLESYAGAEEIPKALVPLKMVVTVPAGSSMTMSDPDGNSQNDIELSDFTTMNSGDKLTSWHGTSNSGGSATINTETGEITFHGPFTCTLTRQKI